MSVSNHRPYTYPAGRIPIPNDAKSRAGGVMYSDYALGGFLDAASREPWFDNTVFVITADHCASSAGKTEIPLEKYHIPAMIYAPAFVAPGSVGKTASQIDLMPTLFSLLGMDYDSWFYGRDILADDFRERAFVATYQDLGYLEGDRFTVLSPGRPGGTIPAAADGRRSLRAGTHRGDRQHAPQSCHFALSDLLAMEQTISKFPNPFGSVAPHKLFAWGLSATVGYGFAIWGVRIYQNQTVELGGQLLVVLMQAFVLPALLYGADRLRRRFPVDATALFGGLLFAQIPRLAGECRQRMALRMAAAARQRLGFAAARDDAGGRFGRFGQRHRFVRHLEHDLGLAGILPCDAREGPPQHRRLRRMLCPRGHPARNHSSNATARLALELVAKTTKGNTGGSGQSERLSRSARFIGQSGRFCRSYRLRRRSISKRDLQRNRSRTATVAAPAGR